MEKLKYIIEDSTIAEVLGVQNFTNEESAILELVKNAYDAQSLDVVIIISKSQIIIEDNGIGMNRQKILGAWMHVGISDKKYIIGAGETARVLAGSKGVGRFAIARLGAKASVYTKMDQQEAVLWKTDWNTNTLETYQEIKERGTKIVIEQLRDNWTESRVRNLREFLSRTYNDDKMKIQVEYKEDRKAVTRYFGKIQLGVNCVSVIRLQYLAKFQKLVCDIESDEFKENVKKLCPDIDTKEQKIELNIVDELDEMKNDLSEEATLEEWKEVLENVGDFSAELYFSLKNPSTFDAEKYFYKHRILVDRYEAGVVLYRNAFSISSYEGKKDWLGFGKRSRKSPAAASHPKCAYCGAMWGLLPVESFEVDHFFNEASFPDTTAGRTEAGRMINLAWACISCNRGKRGITIKPPYDDLLNVDNGNIATVFKRDEDYYIQICDTYQDDEFVQQFYDALHLGYETRRLDYLGLQIEGKYQVEKDEECKRKLGETLSILLKKRNRMAVTGGIQ